MVISWEGAALSFNLKKALFIPSKLKECKPGACVSTVMQTGSEGVSPSAASRSPH